MRADRVGFVDLWTRRARCAFNVHLLLQWFPLPLGSLFDYFSTSPRTVDLKIGLTLECMTNILKLSAKT